MANRRVAIVGASTSDCGRVDDKTAFQLNFQGTTRALADAGIEKSEIDGFMSLTGALPPVELAEYLGIRPNWVDSTGHGGSIWEFMVEHAAAAIAQGLVEVVVLTYGSTQRADLKKKLRMANLSFGTRGPIQFAAPFGHPVGSHYAMVARRHMHEFGTSLEQLAEVAVSTRYNAGFNPDAYYQDPITIDEVLSSPMVWDPLSKLHCCIRSDGGGAIVLTHEERARDCAKAPVWILGTGEAVSHTTMSEWEDFTESPCVRSGQLAFDRAGVTPEEIDTVQVYDAFTPMVILTLEGLGFCKKGRAGPSSRTASSASVVRCRPTRTVAVSQPASRGCEACSCSSRPSSSCGANAARARCPTPSWRASTGRAAGSPPPAPSSWGATRRTDTSP